ncbi:type 1 secretion target domain [Micractinium conductrix]|uniref:Type 1 secretion target domain n=1 Tax=Micractinium conductrix TaxID=554055 RepID=A0A2P6VSI3_9CHLO|nr:type 1 secretion target domain [Micractinium conductrix]|eukprot:PSC77042.1 type 1 secretion target domain [Micractinium conductrix]
MRMRCRLEVDSHWLRMGLRLPTGVACIGPGECGCPACQWGDCYNGGCECYAGYAGPICSTLVPGPNDNSPVGANVAGLAYYSAEWVFVDVMKASSPWFTSYTPDTTPTNAFDTGLILRNVLLRAMPGRYVVLWDGEGRLEFAFDSKLVSHAKKRAEFVFAPTSNPECAETGAAYCGDNGISVRVVETNPANPLRNLRLVMPGFEAAAARNPFHPWYLKSLERYSVLRFYGWMDIWSDSLPSWEDRTKPGHDTQARLVGVRVCCTAGCALKLRGAALEHIVDLCNRVGASPWINVHHLADEAYMRNLAGFFRDRLRPDLQLYVEHSNEVWNAGFAPGKYAAEEGLGLGLSSDAATARNMWHGLRMHEIADTPLTRLPFAHPIGVLDRQRGDKPPAADHKAQAGHAGADAPHVWGYAYNVTFARSHAPTGQLAITLHQHTNCGDDGAPLYSFPLAAASLAASSAWVTLTTPDDVAGSGMFLQIAGSGGKNFSELFSIEPRTARTGWFSPFKPFDDCTAQWSPSPGAEPLAARGIALAATTPGATVVDSLCAGSPTSRECTVPCEASPEAGAAR